MPSLPRFVTIAAFLAWIPLAPTFANWTASGRFLYVDREFDQTGFTGAEPAIPVRLATVEVRAISQNGGSSLLATGATDANGNFSIAVNDNKTRTVFVRALTIATGVPTLHLKVTNRLSPKTPYAVASASVPGHAPNVNVNFGTITAAIGAGGEPFNLYDVALNSVDFIAALNGARPGSADILTLEWEMGFGGIGSSYNPSSNTILVADNSGYNDSVISHESAHYAYDLYSASDSPGGVHHLSDCNQDVRLAYDEGRATWFGQSVRRHFGLPRPDLYVKTTGAAGAGNLDFYFDVETETPFYCDGASSEVAVYAALWDINDAAATADGSPGLDDDPLERSSSDNWDVDRNHIPTAANKSLEDFWDGWFLRGKNALGAMIATFQRTNVEFYPDPSEPNDGSGSATPVAPTGASRHVTYFADPEGDGAGAADTDYFSFSAASGTQYTIETLNLWGKANTSLELLGSDGSTVLASNDDRGPTDKSSLIVYTPSTSSILYVRSVHAPDLGIYGSYDLRVSGGAPVDGDGDGYLSDVDCNDANPAVHPGAVEVCNGIDDNCAGGVDEGFDGDGDGHTTCGGDCNDANPSVHPGAVEVCNGIDDNCAGGVDEGFDVDADGYRTCDGDCNDADPAVHPGAVEVCNGIDDNCAGGVDEGFDGDGDGHTTCGGDCNDANPAVNPAAVENCSNGIDDDCDSLTDSQDPACQSDTVVITKAEWKQQGKKLTVWATSTGAPQATLTLVGYGTMNYDAANNRYTFTKSNTPNPGSVTVTSSQGGSDTETVTVL